MFSSKSLKNKEKYEAIRTSKRRSYSDSEDDARRKKYRRTKRHQEISSNEESEASGKSKCYRRSYKVKKLPHELCDAKYYTEAAIKYFNAKKFSKAIYYINIALKLSSRKNEALSKLYQFRGKCYTALEAPCCSIKAIVDFERSLNLNPSNKHAQKSLSKVLFIAANKYYREKQYEDAINVAAKAVELFNENSEAAILLKHLKKKHLQVVEIEESTPIAKRDEPKMKKHLQVVELDIATASTSNVTKDEPQVPHKRPECDFSLNPELQLHDAQFYYDAAMKEFEKNNFPRALILINKALRTYPCDDSLMNKLHEMKEKIIRGMKDHKVITTTEEPPEISICESSVPIAEPPSDLEATKLTTINSEILSDLQSSDAHVKLNAAVKTRNLLSEENAHIDDFINDGGISYLISNLLHDNVPLQLECCKALRVIAAGTASQTQAVIDAGSIPFLIRLIPSHNLKLAEEAIFALGDIIGKSPEVKDIMIDNGIISSLLSVITPHISTELRRMISHILSRLCESKNNIHLTKECIQTFAVLICNSDPETVTEACWGISHLTEKSETIKKVIDCGIVPRLVELLLKPEVSLKPIIRSIGNILAGDDSQAQEVIDAGVLHPLKILITDSNVDVVKDVCWVISNITAGNTQQIQAVIDSGIIEYIIKILNQGDCKSQKKAAWAICNLTVAGTVEQILSLMQFGVITPVCNLLSLSDPNMLKLFLDILNNILNAALKTDNLQSTCFYIEHCNGLSKIENLQMHEDMNVYKAASGIINAYFGDDVTENENEEQDKTDFQSGVKQNFTFAEPILAPVPFNSLTKDQEKPTF